MEEQPDEVEEALGRLSELVAEMEDEVLVLDVGDLPQDRAEQRLERERYKRVGMAVASLREACRSASRQIGQLGVGSDLEERSEEVAQRVEFLQRKWPDVFQRETITIGEWSSGTYGCRASF